jgi:hypothetical protein
LIYSDFAKTGLEKTSPIKMFFDLLIFFRKLFFDDLRVYISMSQ